MAITSLDGLVAGFQQPHHFFKALSGNLIAGRNLSTFYLGGIPGAAAAPAPGMAGEALTTYAGQMGFTNPPGGQNTYLARFAGLSTGSPGTILLCDRLWHNSGISPTVTTAQTVNSVAFPARDANGTANGVGVLLGLEISALVGAGTPTITVGYTNSSNVSGRSGTNAVATTASAGAGAFYPIGLAAGDMGVRSVQSVTLSATWTSGTLHLVAYRVLAALSVPQAAIATQLDAVTGGMPRLYDNTVPFLMLLPSTTTASSLVGTVTYAQG